MKIIKFIAENADEKLYPIAKAQGLSVSDIRSLAIRLLHLPSQDAFTEAEISIYEMILKPLIEEHFCEGAKAFITTQQTCMGRFFIDHENIYVCYMDKQGKCKIK